ncbi:MAG: DUF3373 family protein [Campylobacterota bacterium]|nr:DUF3373 family protein [Campylobacterota bacterium]
MKKKIIGLSIIASLTTSGYAATNADMQLQLDLLKKQIAALQSQMEENTKSVKQVTKKTKKIGTKLNKVKAHGASDNIKWDVDFRTAFDSIHYKHASGAKSSNPDLLTNRLWLGMGFSPDENTLFKGKLSYFKAYGDTANHSQSNTNPGYANFDWLTSENATDNTLKVKEAYWLYMNDTFIDKDIAWTVSVGRRPSTDGLGINLREGMKDNSPLSHTVNVEFDGASAKFNLDKVTGVDGMWWKLCTGRGLTNAVPRFSSNGLSYSSDDAETNDINMYGFIFVPWDNGQYSVHTNWARAENLIGFAMDNTNQIYGDLAGGGRGYGAQATTTPVFRSFGDMDLLTGMVKAEGIGDGINDFLDDTTVFASWAQSKTNPKSPNAGEAARMLGSTESKTGTSTWIGINMPDPMTDDGRIGIEWNKGSKYWRSVTYGEDTMAGSKIAARGTAWEVYYNKPINKALTFNARYTKIDYDYTGSQSFFGDDGTPMTMDEAVAAGQDPVKEATDLRVSVSYRF